MTMSRCHCGVDLASENEVKRRVSAALDKVGLLDKARCLPMQLSGGEQQRVGIAPCGG